MRLVVELRLTHKPSKQTRAKRVVTDLPLLYGANYGVNNRDTSDKC